MNQDLSKTHNPNLGGLDQELSFSKKKSQHTLSAPGGKKESAKEEYCKRGDKKTPAGRQRTVQLGGIKRKKGIKYIR